jgi:hypothetical protein
LSEDPTIRDVLSRPAMNGGFDRLIRQQDKQMVELRRSRLRARKLEREVSELKARFTRIDRATAWILGATGSIAVTTIGKILYDFLHRVEIVVK